MPGQHLVVAGIGKCHAVGDNGDAPLGLVSENLPLLRHHAPQKREQCLSTLCNIVTPELLPEILGSAQTPPCSLSIKAESAPVKISCQRNPSLTIRTTLRVFSCGAEACAADPTTSMKVKQAKAAARKLRSILFTISPCPESHCATRTLSHAIARKKKTSENARLSRRDFSHLEPEVMANRQK